MQSGALASFIGALRAEDDAALLDPLIRALPAATAKKRWKMFSLGQRALLWRPTAIPLA